MKLHMKSGGGERNHGGPRWRAWGPTCVPSIDQESDPGFQEWGQQGSRIVHRVSLPHESLIHFRVAAYTQTALKSIATPKFRRHSGLSNVLVETAPSSFLTSGLLR